MPEVKELSLMKSTEKFIFRYETGLEEKVLDAFVDMANDPQSNFDWFDAAVLSFQLSKHLVDQADSLLRALPRPGRPGSPQAQADWFLE